MGRQKWVDDQIGLRIRAEREARGWSQAHVARALTNRGIEPMHATTVAKIESGERGLRVTELAGIADLFETTTDALIGRKARGTTDELAYRLRVLRDTAQKLAPQVLAEAESIREQMEDMPLRFEGDDLLKRMGISACVQLFEGHERLKDLASRAHDLLREHEEEVQKERARGRK